MTRPLHPPGLPELEGWGGPSGHRWRLTTPPSGTATREGGLLGSPGTLGHQVILGGLLTSGQFKKHFNRHPGFVGAFLGQVQSRKCMEDVIHFAWEEKVFLLADEVRALAAAPSRPHTGRARPHRTPWVSEERFYPRMRMPSVTACETGLNHPCVGLDSWL